MTLTDRSQPDEPDIESLAAAVDISEQFDGLRRATADIEDRAIADAGGEAQWSRDLATARLQNISIILDEVLDELRTDSIVSVTMNPQPVPHTHMGEELLIVGYAWSRAGRRLFVVMSDHSPHPWILRPSISVEAQPHAR